MNSALIYYFFSYLTVSVVLALVLVPLMRPLSFKLGAVDKGTGRRAHWVSSRDLAVSGYSWLSLSPSGFPSRAGLMN